MPLREILKYFDMNYLDYQVRITNYTMQIILPDEESIMFSTQPMSKKVFIWYNMIKKSNAGEVREIPFDFKYYDFSGAENLSEDCYCVDINSAYLSVLQRDGILSPVHFQMINQMAQKKHRLQSVGMFAKNPITISFHNGQPMNFKSERDPFSWIFFHAVRETYLAMKKVQEEMSGDFIFFWVDGIFIKGNPERAVAILKECGLDSKIEKVRRMRNNGKFFAFDKMSASKSKWEKKILLLPQNKKIEKSEVQSIIKRSIKI